jgi:hypothetical protein
VKGLLVSNPSEQIELNVDGANYLWISKARLVSKVHCLTISGNSVNGQSIYFAHVHFLNLYNVAGTVDFSMFKQLKSLCYKSHYSWSCIGTPTSLTEISLSIPAGRIDFLFSIHV